MTFPACGQTLASVHKEAVAIVPRITIAVTFVEGTMLSIRSVETGSVPDLGLLRILLSWSLQVLWNKSGDEGLLVLLRWKPAFL